LLIAILPQEAEMGEALKMTLSASNSFEGEKKKKLM